MPSAEYTATPAHPGPAPATHPSPASAPAEFAPGIRIDWQQRAVVADTRVVLRSGPLEFLACFPGKEHESILRFTGTATQLYMALGLVGLSPGRPPQWDDAAQRRTPPTGDLVELTLRWRDQDRERTADAWTWLRELDRGQTPLARPWVFAGSVRAGRQLVADASGVGVALVDFPDSLICLSRAHSNDNAALWVEAHTPAIPAIGTPVELVIAAARPGSRAAVLDPAGRLWLGEREASAVPATRPASTRPGAPPFSAARLTTPADFADWLTLQRRLEPQYRQVIRDQGALAADRAQLTRDLGGFGVPSDAWRIESHTPPSPSPTAPP